MEIDQLLYLHDYRHSTQLSPSNPISSFLCVAGNIG